MLFYFLLNGKIRTTAQRNAGTNVGAPIIYLKIV